MASLVQVDIDRLSVTKTSWGEQFRDAMNVNGGDLETAKFSNYIGHALSFFWKVKIRSVFHRFTIECANCSRKIFHRCCSLLFLRQPSPVVG
jgi:hypothetical protein